jgi:hypothetical protein
MFRCMFVLPVHVFSLCTRDWRIIAIHRVTLEELQLVASKIQSSIEEIRVQLPTVFSSSVM